MSSPFQTKTYVRILAISRIPPSGAFTKSTMILYILRYQLQREIFAERYSWIHPQIVTGKPRAVSANVEEIGNADVSSGTKVVVQHSGALGLSLE